MKADEYLGTDEAGREYFTHGGHVYATPAAADGTGAPRPRGRFSAYNRLRRRHPTKLAA